MKTKTAKGPKQSELTNRLRDMKPKKDAKAGRETGANSIYISTANGGVWKTTDGGR